uniref:Uncharacterized protein n=1 Tax=Magallana gigas TaxID=29159 RepID=A0A8W8P7P0_MAGGI
MSSDGPQTPLNLTVNSDQKGNVNMTWVSGFNEGLDQFFVISRKNGQAWEYVGNLSDLGEGSVMYFEAGTLTPGQNNYFRLETCNMFNCIAQYFEPAANLKGSTTESTFLINNVIYAIIAVSVAVFIIIVILVLVLVMYFQRKQRTGSKNESFQQKENQNCAAEVYTFVEKNFLSKTDELKHDATENNQGMLGEEVLTTMAKEPAVRINEGMCLENAPLEEIKLGTGNTDPSRKRNDEGLIYMDVDFMRKSNNLATHQKLVIHGQEDRTEYTFVDFSKRAPPMQETRDDAEMQEENQCYTFKLLSVFCV